MVGKPAGRCDANKITKQLCTLNKSFIPNVDLIRTLLLVQDGMEICGSVPVEVESTIRGMEFGCIHRGPRSSSEVYLVIASTFRPASSMT